MHPFLSFHIFSCSFSSLSCNRLHCVSILEPLFQLEFIDTLQIKHKKFRLSKKGDKRESRRFKIETSDSLPLRVCLVWTDDLHEGVQNHLGLFVTDGEKKEKWVGNRGLVVNQLPEDSWDNYNNVQIVRIEKPSNRTFYIKVFGLSVGFPPQDFALVVTGSFKSKLLPDGSD